MLGLGGGLELRLLLRQPLLLGLGGGLELGLFAFLGRLELRLAFACRVQLGRLFGRQAFAVFNSCLLLALRLREFGFQHCLFPRTYLLGSFCSLGCLFLRPLALLQIGCESVNISLRARRHLLFLRGGSARSLRGLGREALALDARGFRGLGELFLQLVFHGLGISLELGTLELFGGLEILLLFGGLVSFLLRLPIFERLHLLELSRPCLARFIGRLLERRLVPLGGFQGGVELLRTLGVLRLALERIAQLVLEAVRDGLRGPDVNLVLAEDPHAPADAQRTANITIHLERVQELPALH